jgi:N-methylhydantoinase B
MAIDKRNLQVLANYCEAAADAMAYTLMRTAHSTFVKETEDFSCTILTRHGMAFANPRSFGAPWYSGIDYAPMLDLIGNYEEGDVCICNDAYSGSVATHSPDIHIWMPIFYKGELCCFVAGHIHNTDVGGAVPASLSRSLTEIVQEGIRVPPVKIYRKGELNDDVARILGLNVRAPEQNWGDFGAQIASVKIGERKMLEIIERFGLGDFLQGAEDILDYGEQQARAVIRTIPNGEYFFADYADEDSDNGFPCRVALTVRVEDETVELDYTGSDPQLSSSLNMPTGGRERHPLALVGLTYVLATLNPRILLNAGTLRVARAVLPPGTVMNCEAPAAVGMRSLTCMVSQIATIGAFAQAVPERLPTASPGGCAIMNVKTTDRVGRPVVASIGPVGGGGGGMPAGDGPEGAGGTSSFLKNTPVEINEVEVPILFRQYGLRRDTGGPGRFRGGSAMVMEFEVTAPNTVVTARNRNRSVFASWGMLGGQPGSISTFRKNPGMEGNVDYGNIDVIQCDPGEVVQVIGPGAGGYGDPFTRDPKLVLRDVKCGFVTADRAREDYGVEIRDGRVDQDATAKLRARRGLRTEFFDHGDARTAFERIWTRERYDELSGFLASVPVSWRHYIKRRVFEAVAAGKHADLEVHSQMARLFDELRAEFPTLLLGAPVASRGMSS